MEREEAKMQIKRFAEDAGWRDVEVHMMVKDHPHLKGKALYDVAVVGIFKHRIIEASINGLHPGELAEKAGRHFARQ